MTFLELTTSLLMFSTAIGQGTMSAQSTMPVVAIEREVAGASKIIDLTKREEISRYVKEYFSETPILVDVARCESTYRQFSSNGGVLRGLVNPADVGVMQINEWYHGKKADDLGLDLHTLEGNLAYAKYLYEKQGVQPWKSSAKCWNQNQS